MGVFWRCHGRVGVGVCCRIGIALSFYVYASIPAFPLCCLGPCVCVPCLAYRTPLVLEPYVPCSLAVCLVIESDGFFYVLHMAVSAGGMWTRCFASRSLPPHSRCPTARLLPVPSPSLSFLVSSPGPHLSVASLPCLATRVFGQPASQTRPRTGITSWTDLDSILLLGLQYWLGYGYCGLAYAREDISPFIGLPDNLVTMAVCVHKLIVRTDLWVI